VGLVNDLQRNLGCPLAGKRVLLLGAGGATRGALLPIAAQHPAGLSIANRSADKAHVLKRDFAAHAQLQSGGYDDLAGQSFDVVINATSTGLTQEALPLPAGLFAPGSVAYEMIYGKGLTPFLQQARAAGVSTLADGVGMLVEQAAEAFVWWRGVRPDTGPVIQQLKVPLA
jgi:shikimate dehydrogenase